MKSREVAQRYAEALYELGKEEEILDELEESYYLVWKTAKDAEDFLNFYRQPLIPDLSKSNLLDTIFQDRVHPYLLNYVKLLVKKNRESYLGDILEEFVKIREEKEEIVRVRVYSPFEIEQNGLLNKIEEKLNHIFAKKVRIETIIDEKLLAGIKLEVGGRVVDGSLKAKLNDLEERLAG